MKEYILNNVKWISQGCLRISIADGTIYTDPFDIEEPSHDADYILISHAHHDHFSPEDIEKVKKNDTVFVFPLSMKAEAEKYSVHPIYYVTPGDSIKLNGFSLNAVCAYNIDKIQCHPKENNWVGYVINIDEYLLYYTSDTELIPEMKDLTVDAIFVPLGQTYTMNCVEDAVKAVEYTNAKVAVPIHYGKYEGTLDDANKFISLLENKVDVFII